MIPGIDTIQASDAAAFALFDVKADGVYDVKMEAKMRNNGTCVCVSDKKLVTVDRLAVKGGMNVSQWNVMAYPNPNYGNFTVVISGANELKNMKLMGLNGAVVKEWKGNQLKMLDRNGKKELHIGDLGISAGVYHLEVNTEAGTQVLRLMVE